MKKYLLIIILIFIVGCSLDTFNSDNLASWSINLDFPLFKTNYTIAELLDDYEELEVEYYDQNDSIYVFNASTPHAVDVRDYTIKKDGDDVVPEIVNVPNYEIEIPTLPEELDGINFVDVDLLLQVDLSQFRTDLADSVLVNNIVITGTNDDGITITADITNQMIWQDGQIQNEGKLVVNNPEELINIRPTHVVFSGFITVYPTDDEGTQVFDQVVLLTSILHAPLILEITETSTFSAPPSKIEANIENDIVEGFSLFVDIDNQLEIGGDLQVLVSQDTMNFEENSPSEPDVLFTLELLPDHHHTEEIELDDSKLNLFADSTYMKANINFIGITDGQGNTQPTRFFTGDSIKVLLYSSAELFIDPQNMGEEE